MYQESSTKQSTDAKNAGTLANFQGLLNRKNNCVDGDVSYQESSDDREGVRV